MGRSGLAVYLLSYALGVAGLILGVSVQEEQFLEPDDEVQAKDSQGGGGNLAFLTAVPAAGGLAMAAALLGRYRAWVWGPLLSIPAYLMVVTWQAAWPNVFIVQVSEQVAQATFSINALTTNASAAASVLTPVVTLTVLLLLALGLLGRRILSHRVKSLAQLHRDHALLIALGAPVAIVAAVGSLPVVFLVPQAPRSAAYSVIVPIISLALAGLVLTAWLRHAHLAQARRDPRLAPSASEAWRILHRIDLGLLALLACLAMVAALLPSVDLESLQAGLTFGMSLRVHTQATCLAAIPLLVAMALHRRVVTLLDAGGRVEPQRTRHPGTLAAALATSLVAAAVTDALTVGAAAPWLAATLPLAAWATSRLGTAMAAPWILCGLLAHAIGNTVAGTYRLTEYADLELVQSAGSLALWRLFGATLVAIGAARLVRGVARGPTRLVIPAAVLCGVCAGLMLLTQFSFSAWIVHHEGGEALALGALLAGSDPIVAFTLHLLLAGVGLASAIQVARLLRPDWFSRPPQFVDTPAPAALTPAVSPMPRSSKAKPPPAPPDATPAPA